MSSLVKRSRSRARGAGTGSLALLTLISGAACGELAADESADDLALASRAQQLSARTLVARVEAVGSDAALERSGHALVAVDRRLYVARGVRDDFDVQMNTFPEDVLRLHPRSGSVRSLRERGSEQPGGFSYHCAAGSDEEDAFYSFGGASYVFELDPDFFSSLVVSDTLYRFDVRSRRWQLLEPAGARPSARSGCAAQVFDGALYMFGGISRFFEVNGELWRFDPELQAWTELEPAGPLPPPRYKPAVALDERAGKIYYYGGLAFGPEGFARLDDFWVYDIAENSFRELPSGITPVRDQGSMGVLRAPGGKRYVVHVGGDLPTDVSCTGFPQLARATDEVWAFDIEAETWALLETRGWMPRIEYHAGATLKNRFYFAGGWAEEPDLERTCRQRWNPHFFELSLTHR